MSDEIFKMISIAILTIPVKKSPCNFNRSLIHGIHVICMKFN